jgi:hypothetical protein
MRKSLIVIALLVLSMSAKADLDPLSFMLGEWRSKDFGKGATEFWTGSASSMAGVFRGELNDGRVITEFIQIEATDVGPVMRWNHYSEDYSRWETDPIEHHLKEIKPGYANFAMEQAVKGLPMNLIYSREGDVLTVWVGDLAADDQTGAFELKFERVN